MKQMKNYATNMEKYKQKWQYTVYSSCSMDDISAAGDMDVLRKGDKELYKVQNKKR